MKKFFVATLSLLLTFALAACGDDNRTSSNDDTSTSSNDSSGTSQAISQKEAERIALEKVPGTVVKTRSDEEDGKQVYEVIIETNTNLQEVMVDVITGDIVKVYTDVDYDGDIDDSHNHYDDDHDDS